MHSGVIQKQFRRVTVSDNGTEWIVQPDNQQFNFVADGENLNFSSATTDIQYYYYQ